MAIKSPVDGFLFTPKFRYFLNQMRDTQPNNEFITRWDFANQYDTNRITYTYYKGKSIFFSLLSKFQFRAEKC